MQIEDHHGDFESLLVTAVQFRESKMAPGTSESLQEVTCRLAEEAVVTVQPEKVVHYQGLRRPLTIALAFVLIIAGIIMLIIPGPGLVAIAGGLALWSRDFVWAERTLRYVRKKAPGIPEDGSIPLSTWVSMGLIMGSALALSVVLPRFVDFRALWADIF